MSYAMSALRSPLADFDSPLSVKLRGGGGCCLYIPLYIVTCSPLYYRMHGSRKQVLIAVAYWLICLSNNNYIHNYTYIYTLFFKNYIYYTTGKLPGIRRNSSIDPLKHVSLKEFSLLDYWLFIHINTISCCFAKQSIPRIPIDPTEKLDHLSKSCSGHLAPSKLQLHMLDLHCSNSMTNNF